MPGDVIAMTCRLAPRHVVLSDVSLEDRRELQARRFARGKAVRAVRYLANAIGARLIHFFSTVMLLRRTGSVP